MRTGSPRLEPIPAERVRELGPLSSLLEGLTVYGLLRRCELDGEILCNMADRGETAWLRILKSRRWILHDGFPQFGWRWEAVVDFGPFKSEYNGKHDLPGGNPCDICHTWVRNVHILSHPDWEQHPLVGGMCAVMLSDIDPKWAEKKLAAVIAKQERERLERKLAEERQREAELQRRAQEQEKIRARIKEEIQRQIREEQEAQKIAAAMLRSYARCGEYDPLALRISNTDEQEGLSKRLRGIVLASLHESDRGNRTFQVKFDGIPISGTVYRGDGAWKYVWNLPRSQRFSNEWFESHGEALEALLENLNLNLRERE